MGEVFYEVIIELFILHQKGSLSVHPRFIYSAHSNHSSTAAYPKYDLESRLGRFVEVTTTCCCTNKSWANGDLLHWSCESVWSIMIYYTYRKTAGMNLIYGVANCNGRDIMPIYCEKYPDRKMLCHLLFAILNHLLFAILMVVWNRFFRRPQAGYWLPTNNSESFCRRKHSPRNEA